jgi:hypothetical protein
MPRTPLALLFIPLFAVAAPVPRAVKQPAFGPFGNLLDAKTKCRCELGTDGNFAITVPATHPAAEPNEAGPIRLLAGRAVEGDFALTVRVAVTPAVPGPSKNPEHQWAAGIGLAADGDPGLGAAALAGQETWNRDVNTVAIFRYSRHVQPRSQGLQGSNGARTDVKSGDGLRLRITRRGEVVTGEWSGDGKRWTWISEQRLPDLPGSVTVGPVVARQADAEFTAAIDEYDLQPLPKGDNK